MDYGKISARNIIEGKRKRKRNATFNDADDDVRKPTMFVFGESTINIDYSREPLKPHQSGLVIVLNSTVINVDKMHLRLCIRRTEPCTYMDVRTKEIFPLPMCEYDLCKILRESTASNPPKLYYKYVGETHTTLYIGFFCVKLNL